MLFRSGWGYALAVIGAVNSVIAFGYYGVVMREIWMKPAPYGDMAPIRTPASIGLALGICTVATLAFGILPGVAMYLGNLAKF
mgnify:FL=1